MRLSRPAPRLLANPPLRPNSAVLALMSLSKSISVMLPSFIGLVVVALLRSKCIKVGVWYDPTSLGNLIAATHPPLAACAFISVCQGFLMRNAYCDAENLVSPILRCGCPSWIWMSQLDMDIPVG